MKASSILTQPTRYYQHVQYAKEAETQGGQRDAQQEAEVEPAGRCQEEGLQHGC